MTTPPTPQQNPSPDASSDRTHPESVYYMLRMWLLAVVLEAIHQLLTVAIGFTNVDGLVSMVHKQLEEADQPLSEPLARVAAYGSIVVGGLIALAIVGVLLWMLHILRKGTKRAGVARRIWFAFSIYFTLRLLLTFLATPAGSKAPDWLIMLDGMLVILTGVAAILGLIFSLRRDTLDYTGELEQLKQLEREQRAAWEEKRREKQDKDKDKEKEKQKKQDDQDRGTRGSDWKSGWGR